MPKKPGQGIKNLQNDIHSSIVQKSVVIGEETVKDIRETILNARGSQTGVLRKSEDRSRELRGGRAGEYPNVDTGRFLEGQKFGIDGLGINTAQITFYNTAQALRGNNSYYAAKLEERNRPVQQVWLARQVKNLAILTSGVRKRTIKK